MRRNTRRIVAPAWAQGGLTWVQLHRRPLLVGAVLVALWVGARHLAKRHPWAFWPGLVALVAWPTGYTFLALAGGLMVAGILAYHAIRRWWLVLVILLVVLFLANALCGA